MILRTILVALTISGLSLAQQLAPGDSPDTASQGASSQDTNTTSPAQAPPDTTAPQPDIHQATSGPRSPQWKGLTVKEKLSYDWRHLFDVDNMVFALVGASFDQLRDRPGQWGEGWGPFAERYGSHVGSYIVQRSVFFPVQAIDHEDTRYFRSTRTSYKGRLADAFLRRYRLAPQRPRRHDARL